MELNPSTLTGVVTATPFPLSTMGPSRLQEPRTIAAKAKRIQILILKIMNYYQNGAIPMDQVENSGQYFLSMRFIGEYFA